MINEKCRCCGNQITKNSVAKNYYYGFNINIKRIHKCLKCGLGQVDHFPTKNEIENYYNDTQTENVISGLSEDEIKKFKSPKEEDSIIKFIVSKLGLDKNANLNILDIGAGNGTTLLHINHHTKWRTLGIEPNISKQKTLEKLGVNFISNHFENFSSKHGEYDIVFISQVLEHVISPKETIEKICNILKIGGKLWIDVPNCNEVYFKNRLTDHAPHLTFWTKESITKICENLGFMVVSVGSFGNKINKLNFKNYLMRDFKYYVGWMMKYTGSLNLFTKKKNHVIKDQRVIKVEDIGKSPQFEIHENEFENEKLYMLAFKK